MGTAPIEHRGHAVLKLAEDLRQRRASKWSDPEHGQLVPLELLDGAIVMLVGMAFEAGRLTDAEYARFDEAWNDK